MVRLKVKHSLCYIDEQTGTKICYGLSGHIRGAEFRSERQWSDSLLKF